MNFGANEVAELREKTGCGMMDCKKALTEANGNMVRAIEVLRERGVAVAAKKAGRIAAEGIVAAITKPNVGVLIEINSETDFVAKNQQFIEFSKACAEVVATENPANISALLTCNLGEKTVEEELKEKILVIGENLKIRRFARFEGTTRSYIHGDGRIGVLVLFNPTNQSSDFEELAKDIAMQIAAHNPSWLARTDVAQKTLEKERQILTAQVVSEGKPENIAQKIVDGRIEKYYKENCLMEQEFIKNPDLNVSEYIDSISKKINQQINIVQFTRFERGEGLQKKEDNFANEVAEMLN
ncbi:MAG: translation elongation factor Ts [Oscillospiraceae bacterium]|nr:translation elongation factor Ts [Oscillospiraceae bacterium]